MAENIVTLTKLTETDLAYFQFEFLMLLAEIFNFNIHNRKSGRFMGVNVEDGSGPGILFVFAIILTDGVLGLAPVPDLHVVPGHEGDGIPRVAPGVVEGHGALAVEDDLLLRPSRLELEMIQLVTVRLVVDVKTVLLVVPNPHIPLVRDDTDGLGQGRFGLDASGSGIQVAEN